MHRGVVVFFVGLFLLAAPLAAAHQHPAGCSQAAFTYDWGPGLDVIHRNGDVVAITAKVGNNGVIGTGICDVTDATVTLQFPNSDGTSGGPLFTLATNVDFPAGSAPKSFATKKLTLGFDPGVFRGPVTIGVTGVWHVAEPDTDPVTQSSSRFVVISQPHVTFSVSPTISLVPPFTVAYDYSAENDSPSDPVGEVSNPTPGVVRGDGVGRPLRRRSPSQAATHSHDAPDASSRARPGRTVASARCRPAPSSTSPPSRPRATGMADHGRNEEFAWRGAGASSRTSSAPTRQTC